MSVEATRNLRLCSWRKSTWSTKKTNLIDLSSLCRHVHCEVFTAVYDVFVAFWAVTSCSFGSEWSACAKLCHLRSRPHAVTPQKTSVWRMTVRVYTLHSYIVWSRSSVSPTAVCDGLFGICLLFCYARALRHEVNALRNYYKCFFSIQY